MTTAVREKIIEKLKYLEQGLEELEEYQHIPADQFQQDKRNEYSVERLFQTTIESAIDIARLIIIEYQLERPGETRGEFAVLSAADILPSELSQRLSDAKKFRNVLVHEYVGVDLDKVREHLEHDLPDLARFAQIIGKRVA